MQINVGDKVVVNCNNPSCSPLSAGDVVTVVNYSEGEYEVEAVNGVTWWVAVSDIDIFIDLPHGVQFNLGPILPGPETCDCGGYKTFKSMAPQYHSSTLPCSSLKKL